MWYAVMSLMCVLRVVNFMGKARTRPGKVVEKRRHKSGCGVVRQSVLASL